MAARKPPPIPTQDPDDLLAEEPTAAPDTVPTEDGLVMPLIPDDPEHDRLVDPED